MMKLTKRMVLAAGLLLRALSMVSQAESCPKVIQRCGGDLRRPELGVDCTVRAMPHILSKTRSTGSWKGM